MARGLKKIIRSDVSEYADSDVVPLNPADSAPQTVGELLQTKRQEFGVDLREAAEYLNIRYAYLLSIEEGRVDDLPGAAYAMGFVRAYADYLGLDGPAIVERYKDETAELGDDVRLVFPSPLPEGKVPSGAIILIGIVALALVYGGWVFLAQQNVKIAELVPALPEKFSSLLGGDESVEAVPETGSDAPQTVTSTPVQAPVTEPQPTPSTVTESQPQIAETPPAEVPAAEKTEPTDPTPAMAAENSAAETSEAVSTPSDSVVAETEASQAQPAEDSATRREAADAATANASETVSEQVSAVSETVAASETAGEPATVPAGTASPDSEPAQTASAASAPESSPSPVVVPVDQVDAPTTSPAVQAAEEALPLPPKPPAVASAEPRQFGGDNAGSRIMIKARIDSWVQIRDQDGEKLLTRVLRAGDSYRVPNRPGLLMETGNAGGLEITVDSAVIPDLGPKGAVRRDIALDADSLKAGASR